jgi:hypothetical protein
MVSKCSKFPALQIFIEHLFIYGLTNMINIDHINIILIICSKFS